MKFTGKVTNGKLTLDDTELFKQYLYNFDGYVSIEIKASKKVRSAQQNAYYRVIVRELGKELGYTEHEMHKVLKEKYDLESTKDLSVKEFGEYIDHILRWAVTDMGIVLPDPKQVHQL
tara:strand:- start:1267 stop:1620 length:354 start_codon:yes stop_codon:yes gene_type:complete